VEITVGPGVYRQMIEAYIDDESKKWVEATVIVDGITYERVGVRLKGNVSLRGITLNTNCTVLSIPPRALAQLRSLVVGGENLILANTSLGFTRTLGRGALVLSESGYATLAIAIIG